MDVSESSTLTSWLSGCALLTSLRLDFNMGWWADVLGGQAHTPLAVLSQARSLMFLDLMFADSSEASAGLIDNRLLEDLASLSKLEEVRSRETGVKEAFRGGTRTI